MANLTITNEDMGGVVMRAGDFRDALLTFAAADTFVAGTILAQKLVSDTVTAAAGTNTGNGTCTAAATVEGPVVPLVGAYTLTCTAAVTHGGVFKLTDPNGAIVSAYLAMTAGAGVATVFEIGGLTFTLTDGSTDFVAGDSFTLTTTAVSGKFVPFAITGKGGAQIPVSVLTYEVSKTSSGDVAFRYPMSGLFDFNRLVIDADGDNSNVTEAIINQLRHYGIEVADVADLSILDNQ